MELLIPTEKQFVAIRQIMQKKNVLLTGGARAGKTFSILFAIPWLIRQHKNDNCVLAAKSLANIDRNLLEPLRGIYGSNNVSRIIDKRNCIIFGKTFWCIPFNDESSADRLQGTSIGLAILDEIVLCPESYYLMLRTRLDKPFSQLLATCNPENETHYIKTNFIDNKDIENKFIQHWTLYDNKEHLSPEVIKDFESAFKRSPTFYRRMIKGEWCSAEGLACFNFDREKHFRKDIDIKSFRSGVQDIIIGFDPANANDMTAGATAVFDNAGNSRILRRFAHDPKMTRQLSNIQQVGLMRDYVDDIMNDSDWRLNDIYGLNKIMLVDCAGHDLWIQLCYEFEPKGWKVVKMTKKDIKQTLDIMNNTFAKNKCIIIDYGEQGVYDYLNRRYTYEEPLIKELQGVRIRDKRDGKTQTVELNPGDPNDSFDALRYIIAFYFKVEDMREE